MAPRDPMQARDSSVSLAPVLLLSQLEALARKVLEFSPATRMKLARLGGQIAHVRLTAPRLDVFVVLDPVELRLLQVCEDPVAVRIEGSAPALLRQMMQPGQFRAGAGVNVDGDLHLAQTLSELARQLDFDWEELIAQHVGDVAAHQIGQTLRKGASFFGALARKALTDGRRFLVNEQPTLVERPDLDRFSNDVHQLRQDYDRIEARVARLSQRVTPTSTTESPE